MSQLTCEKDVGMGLCMFNFVMMLSLHLVSVLFGTSIPTSLYIFLKKIVSVHFFYIYILLRAFPCNTGEYCTSAGMYFHESEGQVKILPA